MLFVFGVACLVSTLGLHVFRCLRRIAVRVPRHQRATETWTGDVYIVDNLSDVAFTRTTLSFCNDCNLIVVPAAPGSTVKTVSSEDTFAEIRKECSELDFGTRFLCLRGFTFSSDTCGHTDKVRRRFTTGDGLRRRSFFELEVTRVDIDGERVTLGVRESIDNSILHSDFMNRCEPLTLENLETKELCVITFQVRRRLCLL